MRFHWVHARIELLDPAEAREFFVDAWRLCVPKFLQRAYDEAFPTALAAADPEPAATR